MKLHIYIFRHGETYYNRSRRFTGRVNSRLTPKGIKQSNIIAEKLRKKKFQIAFKTSLSRSSDSLKIVLKYHPECKKVIVDDRMIERSYGDFEGKFHKTVIKKYGKKQFDIWHRSYDVPPPGGESIKMVEKRVLSFIKDLIALMKRDRANVVISAHGNSMRPFR
ncbi:2,3-bisphosphoglycerate-dependent phosphoglycerate mutase, partial [Candidatus Bathyarchaeota archaeon]